MRQGSYYIWIDVVCKSRFIQELANKLNMLLENFFLVTFVTNMFIKYFLIMLIDYSFNSEMFVKVVNIT